MTRMEMGSLIEKGKEKKSSGIAEIYGRLSEFLKSPTLKTDVPKDLIQDIQMAVTAADRQMGEQGEISEITKKDLLHQAQELKNNRVEF